LERIQEIADYIAEDSRVAAGNWVDEVFKKIEKLKSNPEIGRIVPETAIPDIRELLFGNYRIIYLISKKYISILTIRHFKQLLPVDEIIP